MIKNNKKAVVLGMLAPMGLFSLIYGIMTPAPSHRRAATVPPPSLDQPAGVEPAALPAVSPQAPEAAAAAPSALVPGTKSSAQGRHVRTQVSSWGRNPFSRADILTLKGIAWDPNNPKAVINDRIIAVGDEVSGNIVVDIQADQVMLSNGASDFILQLPEDKAKSEEKNGAPPKPAEKPRPPQNPRPSQPAPPPTPPAPTPPASY